MRMVCPTCSGKGELMEASNGDVALHCTRCGAIFDIEIVHTIKGPNHKKFKALSGPTDIILSICEAGGPHAWAFSEEGVATLKMLRGEGRTQDDIATMLGTSRATLYRWAREDPDFAAAIGYVQRGDPE